MLLIKILGAAAGGGYPQWNCRCDVCQGAWRDLKRQNTQSSIAFSVDNNNWYLGNASPDIRQQILATPALHPLPGRQSPIRGVFLTNADLDHMLGLLMLREETPWSLFATKTVLNLIAQNALFEVLNPKWIERIPLIFQAPVELGHLTVHAFPVAGKPPLYLSAAPRLKEYNLGLQIIDKVSQKKLVYIPGCGKLTPALLTLIEDADCLLFDGTLWENNELIVRTGRNKTGTAMAHLPIAGKNGSLHALRFFKKPKYYIHINNSNPLWLPDSKARFEIEQHGWQIAEDGMEIRL
ncbi:pyrroloquinoline quinone biosynthesis protein PqqB [Legionella yabuuchiae]|uniref:pyrroloquinoline quinone biosynthesis protein PqqB n=1 Tax=Legionella yabuuchiae TaxID=376727 RepID=UPI00105481D3|nr:pyrroloquinoline quinone biosynthesis protein PqqB [Legionella yabuuchiae]